MSIDKFKFLIEYDSLKGGIFEGVNIIETYFKYFINKNDSAFHKPIKLNEIGLNRLSNYHLKNGFIIISASRNLDEVTPQENKKNTESLKNDIRNKGYSYIPVEGGYMETLPGGELQEVTEVSFIIPNNSNINSLFELGKYLCSKYNQETFLFNDGESEEYVYYDSNGNKQDWGVFNSISLNNVSKQFFTKLQRGKNRSDRRFTFERIYFNNYPNTINEMRRRREGEKEIIPLIKEDWIKILKENNESLLK